MASKQRKLDERHGLEVNAKGHRFKLNRDRAGFHNTLRDDVADETDDSVAPWRLPTPPPLRAHGPLIQVEGAAYSFRCPAGPGKDVISGVTLGVDAGAKMAFVGANGEGKSTIMGLLAGLLEPTKGEVRVRNEVRRAHLEQVCCFSLCCVPCFEVKGMTPLHNVWMFLVEHSSADQAGLPIA